MSIVFMELTPYQEVQKRLFRIDNIDSIEDAEIDGKEFTLLIFNSSSNLNDIIVKESYMTIWESLQNLNMVEEVNKDE